jgi:hypothetical protein
MKLTTEDWLYRDPVDKDKNSNYKCSIVCSSLGINLVASLPPEFNIDSNAVYEESMAQALNNTPAGGAVGPFARIAGLQLVSQAMTAQVWQGSTEFSFNLPLTFQAEKDEIEEVANSLAQLMSLTLPDELTPNGLLTAPGPSLDIFKLTKAFGEGLKSTAGYVGTFAKNMGLGSAYQVIEGGGLSLDKLSKLADESRQLASSNYRTSENTSANPRPNNTPPASPLLSAVRNPVQLMIGNHMFFECVVLTSVNQTHYVQPLASGVMGRVEATIGFKTFFLPTKKDINRMLPQATWVPGQGNSAKTTKRVPETAKTVAPGVRKGM